MRLVKNSLLLKVGTDRGYLALETMAAGAVGLGQIALPDRSGCSAWV
jgi:hypothetical protein